jgi:hypothetical protein
MAASQGTSAVVTFGGIDPRSGDRYVSYDSLKGRLRRPAGQGLDSALEEDGFVARMAPRTVGSPKSEGAATHAGHGSC